MDKLGYARVVKAILESSDKLNEAMSAAQQVSDNKLFGVIYQKQTDLWELVCTLVKDKQ